jgi:hypothetical protein
MKENLSHKLDQLEIRTALISLSNQGNISSIAFPLTPIRKDPLTSAPFQMLFSSIVAFLFFATSTVAQPPCTDKGKGVIDDCCTEDLPICVHWNGAAAHGVTGHHCALCINSQFPLSTRQTAPDEGCDEEFRVCVGDRPLAASVEGKDCAVCVNSLQSFSDPNDMDDGCPPQAPVCVNDSGADPPIRTRGTQCVAKCVDTSLTGSDQGVSLLLERCSFGLFHVCSDG